MKRIVLLLVFCGGIVVLAAPSDKNTEDFEFVEDRPQSTPSLPGTRTWLLDPSNALCSLLRCGKREVCLLQDRFTAVCVDKSEVARSGDRVVPLHSSSRPLSDQSSENSEHLNYMSDDFEEEDDDDYSYDDDDDGMDDEEDDEESMNDEEEEDDEDEANDEAKDGLSTSSPSTLAPLSPQLDRQPFASKHCGDCPLTRPVFLCGTDNHTYSSTCRLHVHNCLHQAKVEVACKGFCPCKENGGRRSSRRSKNSLMAKLRSTQQERREMFESQDIDDSYADNIIDDTYGGETKMIGMKKYKKHGKGNQKKKNKMGARNRKGGPQSPINNVWGPNECSQDALAAMGNRMLDWFSVIMSDTRPNARQGSTKNARSPAWCKREVSWMLGHLDTDGSGQLEARELYQLEHDDRERCIKPFLDRCDLDRDGQLSAREWCKCFDESERPCAALRTASQGLLGGFIPECDSEGWYRPIQCHGSVNLCWCVDRHGVELPSTRIHGKPKCDTTQVRQMTNRPTSRGGIRDDDEDNEDGTVLEGSADMPLDI